MQNVKGEVYTQATTSLDHREMEGLPGGVAVLPTTLSGLDGDSGSINQHIHLKHTERWSYVLTQLSKLLIFSPAFPLFLSLLPFSHPHTVPLSPFIPAPCPPLPPHTSPCPPLPPSNPHPVPLFPLTLSPSPPSYITLSPCPPLPPSNPHPLFPHPVPFSPPQTRTLSPSPWFYHQYSRLLLTFIIVMLYCQHTKCVLELDSRVFKNDLMCISYGSFSKISF